MKTDTVGFSTIEEHYQQWLKLWPHRHDYIYAQHPEPAKKPHWVTESRHPLGDRLILQGAFLYGVRFGPETRYALLDIDAGSPYHPRHDPLAIERITEALEPLGLVTHVATRSSDNGGLHFYFPFEDSLPSWQVALAISTLLENAGLKCLDGWLEVLPNARASFGTDSTLAVYKGHRLPLQQGSYLLDNELQPITASKDAFVRRWRTASRRNDIERRTLKQVIRQARRKRYRVSQKARKFLADLDAEIELGWTGRGQTNRLLGRIAMRSYIFGHVLTRTAPLTGDALITDIVSVATQLPGYTDFCDHQHEIRDRATDWARCVEKSAYYPYGGKAIQAPTVEVEPSEPTWNDQQQSGARERIRAAVAALLEAGQLPTGITARYDALVGQGVGGATLYRHKDCWHPRHIQPVENLPPNPPLSGRANSGSACFEATDPESRPSLLSPKESDSLQDKGFSDCSTDGKSTVASDVKQGRRFEPFSPQEMTQEQGLSFIRGILTDIKHHSVQAAQRRAHVLDTQQERQHQLEFEEHQRHRQKMLQWLNSGELILINEAELWLCQHGFEP